MAKQKFCCKGVLRATGQRVSIMVSADSKEMAVQLANKHGVKVENAMPVAEPAPEPPKVADKHIADRIDDILSSEDEDQAGGLDDLDLDDDLDKVPTSSGTPSTKSCPYCGEQILAVAVKCKHCGSYVGEQAAKTRQPSGGASPRGVPMRVWVIVGGVVAVVVIVPIVVILVVLMWSQQPTPSLPELAQTPPAAAAPSAPVAPPKPTIYKPSPEELAFAAKLTAFLDGCDEMARLLDKIPKMDQYDKQCKSLKSRYEAIPPPPQGAPWTGEAAASSTNILETVNMLTYSITTLDAAMQALNQSSSDSPEAREAYRQAAGKVRESAAAIRSLIPPACSAKPK